MKDHSLRTLKGVGEKTEKLFEKAGVGDLDQLIRYYPRTYEEYGRALDPGEITSAGIYAVRGKAAAAPVISGKGKRSAAILKLSGPDGSLQLIWFHMPYLRSVLKRGNSYVFRGRVVSKNGRFVMEQPKIYSPEEYRALEGTLQPVYALTAGLTNRMVSQTVRQAFDVLDPIPEILPDEIRESMDLIGKEEAMRQIHFPQDAGHLQEAVRRLAFEEFFLFLLGISFLKEKTSGAVSAYRILKSDLTDRVIRNLPYELTAAQKQVFGEIERDMTQSRLMNRLIQGDVGSGKTILAFLAMLLACASGYQSVLMAPTEVLAAQHFRALTRLLEENGLTEYLPVYLTGSVTGKARTAAYEKIASGEGNMIIGTHALIQEKVGYNNPALVITDEQHRFGVRQRALLSDKGEVVPHVLVMSATPIPRTLALILYGDLEISLLNELPGSRLPVKNALVDPSYRPAAYRFMEKEIRAGRQVYIICPMIDESESEELNCENVTDYSEMLRDYFPEDIRIETLHGRMKPAAKDAVMQSFAEGKIHILVSTTVVEVGVDIPNATVMMIENAERFGLAQLHQLRGRVGRGKDQSYCIFVQCDGKEESKERLKVLQNSNDGFHIADEDLRLRGPGDLFGLRQSGMAEFRIADIYRDAALLKDASAAVKKLLNDDPQLTEEKHAALRAELAEYASATGGKTAL